MSINVLIETDNLEEFMKTINRDSDPSLLKNYLIMSIVNDAEKIIDYLLDFGNIDINSTIEYKRSETKPMITAIELNRINSVQKLINKGINVNEIISYLDKNTTYLLIAIYYKHNDIAKLLIDNNSNINEITYGDINTDPIYPMKLAIEHGNIEIMDYMINNGLNIHQDIKDLSYMIFGFDTLGYCGLALLERLDIEIIDFLISKGLNQKHKDECLSLSVLYKTGDRQRLIEEFLTLGANINPTNINSPLLVAVQKANFKAIKFLVRHGADINILYNCHTPLLSAFNIKKIDRYKSIIDYLLDNGADPNKVCPDHDHVLIAQPLTLALKYYKNSDNNIINEEIIKKLLDKGANMLLSVKYAIDEKLIKVLEMFIEKGFDVDKNIDSEGISSMRYVLKLLEDDNSILSPMLYKIEELFRPLSREASLLAFIDNLPKYNWNYSDNKINSVSYYNNNKYEELLKIADRYQTEDSRFNVSFYNIDNHLYDGGEDYKGETNRLIQNLSQQLGTSTYLKVIEENNSENKKKRYLNLDTDTNLFNLNPDNEDPEIHYKIGKILGITIIQQLNLNLHFDPFLLYILINYHGKKLNKLSLSEMLSIVQSLENDTAFVYHPFKCKLDKTSTDAKKEFNKLNGMCKTKKLDEDNYLLYDQTMISTKTNEEILEINDDIIESLLENTVFEKFMENDEYKNHVKRFCEGFYSIIKSEHFKNLTVSQLNFLIVGKQNLNLGILLSLLKITNFSPEQEEFLIHVITLNYNDAPDKHKYISIFIRAITGNEIIPVNGYDKYPLTLNATTYDNKYSRCFNKYDINSILLEENRLEFNREKNESLLREMITFKLFNQQTLYNDAIASTNQAGGTIQDNSMISSIYLNKYKTMKKLII